MLPTVVKLDRHHVPHYQRHLTRSTIGHPQILCSLETSNHILTVVCLQTPGDELTMKVEELVERQEYQFRVKAVNKAGTSEPSESTDWHMAKHRKRKLCDVAVGN